LERVTFVGHDSGGLIARFAAARLGGRVESLILTGTEVPHHHPPFIERLQKVMKLPGSRDVMRKMLANPRLARSDQLLGGLFHDTDLLEGDFRAAVLRPHLGSTERMDRQLEILSSYTTGLVDELEAVHAELRCPTLLVWGEEDPFFPVDTARAMCPQFAGPTQFEVVSNAKLLVHEEHPERFAELCDHFLAGVANH
jgi:pimeloyl-ACP methyl ester carboxylesterase